MDTATFSLTKTYVNAMCSSITNNSVTLLLSAMTLLSNMDMFSIERRELLCIGWGILVSMYNDGTFGKSNY
jgi:hypothetical protein